MRLIRAEAASGKQDPEDERRSLLSRLMEHSYDPKKGIMTDEEIMSESVSHLCVLLLLVFQSNPDRFFSEWQHPSAACPASMYAEPQTCP